MAQISIFKSPIVVWCEAAGEGFGSQYTRFSLTASASKPSSRNKGVQCALDDLYGIARLVAPGPRYFLHSGRVHPYPVGLGHRHTFDSGHPRPKDCLTAASR